VSPRDRRLEAAARAPGSAPLAPPQAQALDREGYVVVPGALDAAWVVRLLRAFDATPAQASGTQHVTIGPETPEVAAWVSLRDHPLVAAAASRVLARPFRVRDVHGRSPLPGFGQQGLHADWSGAALSPYFVVTAIWMLDDFTLENGATRVVPGTHRIARAIPKALAQPLARHHEERVVTGRSGSVILMNGHLWHSGRRNESAKGRRAAQMVVVADGDGRP
jgi:ectoine hydroxylase-related dioxygenase (phytanoyl-CoA dioxygenase family)